MNDLEYIDNYFADRLSAADKLAFEQRLANDAAFAEDVAFYVSTKAIEREKLLSQKHAEWAKRPAGRAINFSVIATGIAAVLLIVAGWWFYSQNNKPDLQTLAQNYINTELATLPVKMDAKEDSLELGKQLYNSGKYTEAKAIFDKLSDPKALEFAGLSALKAKNYPEAQKAFETLAQNTDLLENKGKFYLALTYLQQGERQKAEVLLQEIKKQDLFGADLLDVEK
jgi:tetratricopeptide (TPR) repeat protein